MGHFIRWGLGLVVALAGVATAGEVDESIELDARHFKAYPKCGWNNDELERIMKSHSPIKKLDSAWVFRVRGEVMGLPVSEIYIGVCSREGFRDCGPANAMGFTLDLSLQESQQRLKARYKVDFTKEKRVADPVMGDENLVRPHLFIGRDNRSFLSCF